jgi:hypothetical protein
MKPHPRKQFLLQLPGRNLFRHRRDPNWQPGLSLPVQPQPPPLHPQPPLFKTLPRRKLFPKLYLPQSRHRFPSQPENPFQFWLLFR